MTTTVITLGILITIAVSFAVIYILIYNKIQKNIIRINEAEAEIDETLRKRLDLLKELEIIINSNTNLNQDNFKDFNKDNFKISNFDMDRKLSKIADTFNKIKADYPDDLEIESFRNLIVELKINEEKNESAKAYYNKYTTKLNSLIKKFPSNIVARIHKESERNYFDNKDLKDDDILDFKY